MLRRAGSTVAYVGTEFHGFAEADGVRTVMGDLRAAIEKIVRDQVSPVGAGRTDAGVHGWGQVVSLDLPDDFRPRRPATPSEPHARPVIAVRDAVWTDDPDFSARFSAAWRHYRYHVLNTPSPRSVPRPPPGTCRNRLHLWAMQLACDPLIGEHDFSSFCRRPKVADGVTPPSMRRRVHQRRVEAGHRRPPPRPGLLRFEIRANAFCHQMVRSIVGTLVEVGLGKLRAGDVRGILLERDRQAAGTVAPPHGLVLWEVGYPVGVPGPSGAVPERSTTAAERRVRAAPGQPLDPSGPILRPQMLPDEADDTGPQRLPVT